MEKMLNSPKYNPRSQDVYNAFNQNNNTPSENFFAKRAKSIDNAIGTTGAAIAAGVKDVAENVATANLLKDTKTSMNDIAKKYGYNTWNDWQDGFQAAKDSGDTAKVAEMENQLKEFQAQANTNANKATEKAARYQDYMQNNDVSKRINQDRGKFAGSAINTLSTATDVLGLTNGPIGNAIQGGIEGVADELEQNGLDNFSWERAGQNALTGAASGAAVGLVNKGISNSLAKKGGNLFKGGNKITGGINKLGSETTLGRVGSTLATGAGRGAISGAVGGATGAGVSAALNNQDVLGSALQGAKQGLQSGAATGAIMSGANMAINKTPGVGKLMQKVNQANEDWQNSGDNFRNRLDNTLNSGKSVVGNEVAINRLAKGIKRGANGDIRFVDMTENVFNDINNIRAQNGLEPITERQVTAFKNAVNDNLNNRVNEGLSARQVAKIAFNSLASEDARAIPGYYENQIAISRPGLKNDYDSSVIGLAKDGRTSLKSIEPRTQNQIDLFEAQGQQKNGPKSQLGFSLAEEQPTSDAIVSQNKQNVNMNTAGQEPLLAYGESELGNRTRRGMIADALGRFGDTLEGAQTNVTRAAAKDLGIESTGKVVDNVRRKTGITNLETQAKFAKELTGGENSLMDSIQRQALTASESGKTYQVDTTPILKDVNSIVDKYADTNMFGSQNARDKFIRNLKTDISNFDSDVLSISNRMKANAADLRGKGVASPSPLDSAKAKIYSEVANRLDDISYKAIPDENIDAMFDTTISEMRGRATQAANNGNNDIAKAYNKTADALANEPRTIRAYRSFKKDFVDTSKIADLTAQAENGAAVQMGRGFGSGLKRFTGTLLQRPVNAALAKIGGGVNSFSDIIAGDSNAPRSTTTNATLDTTNSSYNPATQLYNAIGRTEGEIQGTNARVADYLTEASQNTTANTLEDMIANTGVSNSGTSLYNSVYGANNSVPTFSSIEEEKAVYFFPPTGDEWTDMLSRAMRRAKDAEDYDAMDSLYSMYQEATSKNATSNAKTVSDLSATQQAQLAKLDSAESAIDELETLFDKTGGGKGPILGNLQSIAGDWGWDSNARTYNQLSEGLINQIALAIGKTDSLNTEGEVKRALQLIPQLTDDATTAKNKLEELRRMLSTTKSSYNTAYGLTNA